MCILFTHVQRIPIEQLHTVTGSTGGDPDLSTCKDSSRRPMFMESQKSKKILDTDIS